MTAPTRRGPVPRESAARCALQSLLRGDPMIGTAPPNPRLLLVEQAGPWGRRGLVDSRCDPDVARRIDVAAAAARMRLQVIRRPGRHEAVEPAGGHLVGIADTRIGIETVSWWRVATLAELADQLANGGPHRPPVDVDTAPLFLVCTHGTHDACCALRGRPLALELAKARPGRVWETSHLGGDRFAANLLILPTGELYGRVLPFAAAELADRVDAGEVVPGLLRGRVGLSPVTQAALVFGYDRLALAERSALQVGTVEQVGDDRALVTLLTPHGTVVVTVAMQTSAPAKLTCRGPADAQARQYRGISITAA